MVTYDEIKQMFEYLSTTGQLIHRHTVQGGKQKGQPAGSPHNQGYLQICIKRKKYLIHRLIWLYHHGTWPTQIDHINGVRSDNRIENLRVCSYSQNHGNKKKWIRNTSGFKGVFYNKTDNSWFAAIAHRHLGSFVTKEDAALAYDKAAINHYGEFALTNKKMGLL